MNPYEVRQQKGVAIVFILRERLGVPIDLCKMIYKMIPLDFEEWKDSLFSSHTMVLSKGMDIRWGWAEVSYSMRGRCIYKVPYCTQCWGPPALGWGKCLWFGHKINTSDTMIPNEIAVNVLYLEKEKK